MSYCIIGDVHGCYDSLTVLLDRANVDLDRETLWFTGDLIGRGPKSLETLRFVYNLGKKATVVLGNHELYFLAIANGIFPVKTRDKLTPLLDAPDCQDLINWLWQKPLLAQPSSSVIITHAGITPHWSITQALDRANEIEVLFTQVELRHTFLSNMYGDKPNQWQERLSGAERYRFIVNSFTRMRYCNPDLSLNFSCKEAPKHAPRELQPWFNLRNSSDSTLVFGHWSALMGETLSESYQGLDTGCVWGRQLTLLRMPQKQRYQVDSCD